VAGARPFPETSGIRNEPDSLPSSTRNETLKSHRPAAGDELPWALWQLRHISRLLGLGPSVEDRVLAGSSNGTSGR